MDGMGKTETQCLDCLCINCRCEESEKIRDEELDAYRMSFDDFLAEKRAEKYVGLDDDMADDCEDWISFLEIREVMEFAEEYGKKCFKHGRNVGR